MRTLRNRQGEAGFTLVEMVVGVTLMVTIVLSFGRAIDGGLRGTQEISDRGAFTAVATSEIESVRSAAFDSLIPGPPTSTPMPASGDVPAHTITRTVAWKSGSTEIKEIDVDVTWQEGASARHVSMSTLRYPGGAGPAVANVGPTASFTTDRTSGAPTLTVAFNAAGSTDSDGSIVSYEWRFGDETTGTGAATTHDYTVAGTYTAVLKVTDDDGATGVTSTTITVATNQAPDAVLTTNQVRGHRPLSVTFNGSGSTDPEGGALTYSWAYGDGTTGSGVTATKNYTVNGTYTAVLTVTDSGGLTDTASTTITVTTNRTPVAALTVVEDGLTVTVDAGASTDADGDPLTYSWDWNSDNVPDATGVTGSYTYTTSNMNLASMIRLTVSDGLASATATSNPCLISAASFTSTSPSLTNTLTVRNSAPQYVTKAITLRATSNRYCTTMSVALPSETGTYTYAFANQTSGTSTKTWSSARTPAQTYTWDVGPTYTATVSGNSGSTRTYTFTAQ
jgi:PKD repeat protein